MQSRRLFRTLYAVGTGTLAIGVVSCSKDLAAPQGSVSTPVQRNPSKAEVNEAPSAQADLTKLRFTSPVIGRQSREALQISKGTVDAPAPRTKTPIDDFVSPLIVHFNANNPWPHFQEDGGVSGQPFLFVYEYEGHQIMLGYRMDNSGETVNRIIGFADGEKIYAGDFYGNAAYPYPLQATAYYHESEGNRYYYANEFDPPVIQSSPLFDAAKAHLLVQSDTPCNPNAGIALADMAAKILAMKASMHTSGTPGAPPTEVRESAALVGCLKAAAQIDLAGVHALLSAITSVSVTGLVSLNYMYDLLRRPGGGEFMYRIFLTDSGNCGATAGSRGCTSLSAYMSY